MARCALLEQSVKKAATATADAIDAARPGGKENPDTSAMGWLYFFGALSRWHALGPQQPVSRAIRWDGAAMEDMRKALHAEPLHLTLESGRKVAVYPKGDHALMRLVHLQIARTWTEQYRVAFIGLPDAEVTPETIRLLAQATAAIAQLNAEMVAILTHPGPDVPWTDDRAWDHEVPAWMRDEPSPLDLLHLEKANLEVNLLRINAIAERTRQFVERGGDGMPLAAFLGAMAADTGIQPGEIARQWSLGEVFASSLARFEATEKAKARAEAEADAKAPAGARGGR